MLSLQITISPSQRAAARFVARVRRAIQKALAEEGQKRGLTQSDLARAIGVHRSVISRELHGTQDLTLGRVAELAAALGRKPVFDLVEQPPASQGTNVSKLSSPTVIKTRTTTQGTVSSPVVPPSPNMNIRAMSRVA